MVLNVSILAFSILYNPPTSFIQCVFENLMIKNEKMSSAVYVDTKKGEICGVFQHNTLLYTVHSVVFFAVDQHFRCGLRTQVGWSTARDYYTFLWSPMPENYEPGSTVHRTVVFQGTHAHTHTHTHTHTLCKPLYRPGVFQSNSSILRRV